MVKIKTSGRRKVSTKSTSKKQVLEKMPIDHGIAEYDPVKAVLDEDRIARVIWDCLKNGDGEGVVEAIKIHLDVLNKVRLLEREDISKTTLYHSFRHKNPTIKTLAKIVHACIPFSKER